MVVIGQTLILWYQHAADVPCRSRLTVDVWLSLVSMITTDQQTSRFSAPASLSACRCSGDTMLSIVDSEVADRIAVDAVVRTDAVVDQRLAGEHAVGSVKITP